MSHELPDPVPTPPTPEFTRELEERLRSRVRGRARARRRAVLGTGVAAAVLAATLAIVLADDPDDEPRAGRVHRPQRPSGFLLTDGTVPLSEIRERATLGEVRARFARQGARLRVRYVPADRAAVRRVVDVRYPPGTRVDAQGRVVVTPGASTTYVVAIGRRARRGETSVAGAQDIFESIPELCSAVHPLDPRRTESELRERGFQVTWNLVRFGPDPDPDPRISRARTIVTEVPRPPAATKIISVLSRSGAYRDVAPDTTSLLVEVSPDDAEHPAEPGCRPARR